MIFNNRIDNTFGKISSFSRVMVRVVLPAILLVFLARPSGFAQTDQAKASRKAPRNGQFTIKPFRIIGNIYSVGLSNNTSYLIKTSQGLILLVFD